MKTQHYFVKLLIITSFALSLFVNTCKKDEEQKEDYCALVLLGTWGVPSISTKNCTTGTINITNSNATYDQFSRILSYSFSITCGSKNYTGRIYNVTYNDLGIAQSCQATINGTSCTIRR